MAGARSDRLVLPEGEIGASSVSLVVDGAPRPLPRQGDAWIAPSCRDRCTLRYEVDVLAVAQGCRRLDCMHRVGDAVVGMASVWMLRPEPMGDPSVHVELRGGDPSRFATGLRRDPRGGYTMRGREIGEASYTGFGDLRRSRVQLPGGGLDVAILGDPLKMGDEAALGWVKDAASCVARLYGRFPAEATVFVIPVSGADEVVFGRVMSLAGGRWRCSSARRRPRPPSKATGSWSTSCRTSVPSRSSARDTGWRRDWRPTTSPSCASAPAGCARKTSGATSCRRCLAACTVPATRRASRTATTSTRRTGEAPSSSSSPTFASDSASQGRRSFDDVLRASLARLGDATHEATARAVPPGRRRGHRHPRAAPGRAQLRGSGRGG